MLQTPYYVTTFYARRGTVIIIDVTYLITEFIKTYNVLHCPKFCVVLKRITTDTYLVLLFPPKRLLHVKQNGLYMANMLWCAFFILQYKSWIRYAKRPENLHR
jgi:hypothetical protein